MANSESIGSVSDWQTGDDLDLPYKLAKIFLKHVLGTPPPGVRIEVEHLDHDLGSYPTLSVSWDEFVPEPWDFIRRAEGALSEFDQAVDWSRLRPSLFAPEPEDDEGPDGDEEEDA